MSFYSRAKRFLFGSPIKTSDAHHERLPKLLALPVFASDALSSVAYATEAVLLILVYKASQMNVSQILAIQIFISIAICFLIIIVAASYQQTIYAYPTGGGSYIVASDNLGETPGVLAGSAMLIDYILTVAVSTAAGIAALVSAFPELHLGSIHVDLHNHFVPLSLGIVALITWANLRGLKESGAIFAFPTYAFITGMFVMLIAGFWHSFAAGDTLFAYKTQKVLSDHLGKEANAMMAFIILRAFAAGCTALTGVEAVSDGVQAFKAPEAKNAAVTLRWMALILTILFLGVGTLARHLPVLTAYESTDPLYKTLLAQLAIHAFGDKSVMFYFIQVSTALILVLAANTAFADFPRLCSFMSRDGFLPRQFLRLGDRLVFQNGIIILAFAAMILIVAFHGQLDLLLPLYAVGVFMAFTLSQFGMVRHWQKEKSKGWKSRATINGLGAFITFIVTIIIAVTKFVEGAWVVVVLLPIMFVILKLIKKHYISNKKQLAISTASVHHKLDNTVLLLVPRVHRGVLKALDYARSIGLDCRAVHVSINDVEVPATRQEWEAYGEGVPLVILESSYRSLIAPILEYVDEAINERTDHIVTVIVPEYVPRHFYHRFLHENIAAQLKRALAQRQNVVITSVRYFLDE